MKHRLPNILLWVLAWILCLPAHTLAQNSYSSFDTLTDRLEKLEKDYSSYAELSSLAKTKENRDIWVLSIGSGDLKNHPAIAVIGGAKGSHILGSELALKFVEKLLQNSNTDEMKELLETTTFYVLPRINPDATEAYFASLKYERDVNTTSTNDDRDGAFDEDQFNDLNGDELITLMRVEDPTGKWKVHPDEKRLMAIADITKGEKGSYKVYSEGTDDDGDGSFNEDPDGGVNINKNFTYDYPYFEAGAGENMASQAETRAVLDFLFEEAPNVFSVVSFGPANNLSTPVSFNKGAVSKRVISGWYQEDVAINKLVSDTYNEVTGLKNAPDMPGLPGDLFQWAYFHYGRFSFSTPGWWTPAVMDEEGNPLKFENEDAKFLAWADEQNMDVFVEWQQVEHPDFPDKTVEVGGIKPYVRLNPPYAMVDSLSQKHTDFILELAAMKPSLKLVNFKAEKAGRNLTRISVDIHNEGILPTASRLGERTDWVKEVIIDIDLSRGLELVSGEMLDTIRSIEGDGSIAKSWLLRGKGTFKLTAGAPNTGITTQEHTIR